MAKTEPTLQEVLGELWKNSKKDFQNMTKETSKLLKKGEAAFKDVSKKSQVKLEEISATLKKEKLYYQLGKATASTAKNKWAKSKKMNSIVKEIASLNRIIKKAKKKK